MKDDSQKLSGLIREFLRLESAGGMLLMAAAALAMVLANSPMSGLYEGLLSIPVAVQVGGLEIAKPLLLWINDGLMAIFFLLIGLEVKREVLEGQLSDPAQMVLPGVAALGGMIMPALIYAASTWGDKATLSGWAIPTATDIAFALGILALLGDRVPVSLKLFLLTLAIVDDLLAIVIIAIFYSSGLSTMALLLAVVGLAALFILNLLQVRRLAAYTIVGVILWICVLKSGVHATLAGVALAFAIPLRSQAPPQQSPLKHLEHALHPWVSYGILPVFAFANAGVSLAGMSFATLATPVPLGIIAGLIVGKQVGIFGFAWIGIKSGWATLPEGATWKQLYGVSAICGIGFTMSLFIASLAFEHGATQYLMADRLGVLFGSVISALWGYVVLRLTTGDVEKI